jgi:hypothetical protein
MEQIDLLKDKGILVTELKNKRNELRNQWEEAFTKQLSKSQKIKAENIINEINGYINDVYVVDKDFSWAFILTHEYFCGPYFYQQVKE